jgi:hypothetical protein
MSGFQTDAHIEAVFLEKLNPGEAVIGVYRGGPQESQIIVVSDEALMFHDEGLRRVPFSEMRAVKINIEGVTKTEADQLHIQTADGARRTVTVAGGDTRSRDVFEFARFVKGAAQLHW